MNSQQTPAQRTSELPGAMSLSDKIQMVTGQGEFNPTTANPEAAGNIAANPALCIPGLVLNDATAGVGDQQQLTTAFPDSIGLASAWDTSLAQQYYTTFRYPGIAVKRTGAGASVTFTVTNTGSRAGAAVGQVYVGDPASIGEPPKQLAGFRRVELNPAQSATVTIPLGAMSFAHWDTAGHKWSLSVGTYQVMVGSSSRAIAGQGSVALPAEAP